MQAKQPAVKPLLDFQFDDHKDLKRVIARFKCRSMIDAFLDTPWHKEYTELLAETRVQLERHQFDLEVALKNAEEIKLEELRN